VLDGDDHHRFMGWINAVDDPVVTHAQSSVTLKAVSKGFPKPDWIHGEPFFNGRFNNAFRGRWECGDVVLRNDI
jgi:hypothetical protein